MFNKEVVAIPETSQLSQTIAYPSQIITNSDYNQNQIVKLDYVNSGSDLNCSALFGNPDDPNKKDLAYWLQWILNVMKYIAIIALLVLSTLDFFKAIIEEDKATLKKTGLKTAKRFVFAVLMFFLPIIVDLIMTMLGAYGTCGIG